jgi:hypothetical protein
VWHRQSCAVPTSGSADLTESIGQRLEGGGARHPCYAPIRGPLCHRRSLAAHQHRPLLQPSLSVFCSLQLFWFCICTRAHLPPPLTYSRPLHRCMAHEGRETGEGRVRARVSIGAGAAADTYKRIEVCELLFFGDTLAALLDTSKHDDPWSFSPELVMNL